MSPPEFPGSPKFNSPSPLKMGSLGGIGGLDTSQGWYDDVTITRLSSPKGCMAAMSVHDHMPQMQMQKSWSPQMQLQMNGSMDGMMMEPSMAPMGMGIDDRLSFDGGMGAMIGGMGCEIPLLPLEVPDSMQPTKLAAVDLPSTAKPLPIKEEAKDEEEAERPVIKNTAPRAERKPRKKEENDGLGR
jgi:hypothetical protein